MARSIDQRMPGHREQAAAESQFSVWAHSLHFAHGGPGGRAAKEATMSSPNPLTREPRMPIQRDALASPVGTMILSGAVERLFAGLEALAFWVWEKLPAVPWYLPAVEITELQDRDVYRQVPTAVRVTQPRAGAYALVLDVPEARASHVQASVVDGRVRIELTAPELGNAAEPVGRRCYSFPLPSDCRGPLLEAQVEGQILTVVVQRAFKRAPSRGIHFQEPAQPIRLAS